MLYPLTFQPIFKERVWGGRRLSSLYGKGLPAGTIIGESWEVTDRPEGVSAIANGPLAGRDLRWLMEQHGAEILGRPVIPGERFPWLIKILDCEDDLSLQVHPPARLAAELKGEPKTEMWFVAAAEPGAKLYVGLKHGVTRADFERAVADGSVAGCFHVVPVQAGDTMFVPSGRVHALGRGNVIFEIQQNSDTTYRVFDWNRVGLDGRPRELHVAQSLASIDFADFEPGLVDSVWKPEGAAQSREVVRHQLFHIHHLRLPDGCSLSVNPEQRGPIVLAVTAGSVEVINDFGVVPVPAGGFCLLPAVLPAVEVRAVGTAEFLRVAPLQR